MEITHYKMISTRARWLGLDFFDALAIVVAFTLIDIITSALIFDFCLCLLIYIGLRIFKATKPDRWLMSWLQYHVKPRYYQATKVERPS